MGFKGFKGLKGRLKGLEGGLGRGFEGGFEAFSAEAPSGSCVCSKK